MSDTYTDLAALVLITAAFAAVILLTIQQLRRHRARQASEAHNRCTKPEEHQ